MTAKILIYDTIIVGGGVTGFASAMYAARLGLKVMVIAESLGGTIALANAVENYPGFINITGFELAEKIRNHAMEYPIDLEEDRVVHIKRDENSLFVLTTMDRKTIHSKTIIFATGTKLKELNVPGEKKFLNRGVHYCALCDGGFYKGLNVAVIGGADSACMDALLLTQYAAKVYIIYRKDRLRPEPVTYNRIVKHPKIEIIYKTNVKEIHGDTKIDYLQLDNFHNGSDKLKIDGVFIAIGHTVLSDLAKELSVELNDKNEVVTDKNAQTNIPGFFAAGDVTNGMFKQVITGVGEGVHAAYSSYRYVTGTKFEYY